MRFTSRGEEITLEPLQAAVAVQTSLPASSASAATLSAAPRAAATPARSPGYTLATPTVDAAALPISDTALRLFASAGFVFAEPRPRLVEAARFPGSRRQNAVLPAFLDPARNTVLGTALVTLQLPPDMSPAQARARIKQDGLVVVERLGFGVNLYVARLTAQQPLGEAVAGLQEKPWYVFAEPVLLQVLKGRQAVPDPELAQQWQHENAGSAALKKGCDIKTPAAWKTTRGAGMRIAVIDNGMQIDHPDLKGGIVLAASFETNKATGKTEFRPYELWKGFPDAPGKPFPDTNHGTFCLGMAGARRNNGLGGCGSAPEAELMAIACAPDQVGTQLTLAKAVAFAANPATEEVEARGADVLACSLGAENGEWTMQSILEEALTHAADYGRGGHGLPIFWAVSNERVALEKDEVCSHPDVITVGRSGFQDFRGQCAFGPKLDFLAPGDDVFSTQSGGTFGTDSGTSYACPLAAGVAALVLSEYPDWPRDQVRDRLRATCEKIGGPTVEYDAAGHNDDYGFGRIDAGQAVQ